jgi:hypothetical protein
VTVVLPFLFCKKGGVRMRNWRNILLVVSLLSGIAAAGLAGFQYGHRDKIAPPMLAEVADSPAQERWL